ncbi:hypothetical protein EV197_3335 [Aquimarina brevivitae]|uniref:Uncharacterized protein n=1 Tax=Aquimarina brevivitae TaxID=323412 RepID=A0A4Q7NTQ2_9FLAO|nr:hypothetical protein EV197_3335 [Aquimarina brevivitae]
MKLFLTALSVFIIDLVYRWMTIKYTTARLKKINSDFILTHLFLYQILIFK